MQPVLEEQRFKQIGISFPPDLLERIDKMREREPRSHFVCRMLKKAISS